ncbi:unnamed protein product [Angiostrongylus costaricensis]|uniref:PINc domain-containing protein n=1 Tax=Angiostrongylus costaricensis TaxID=334426 RepID=A0A0R3PGY5_ANGCS|nr:unnamed protein product [Angiostrongylus costaricensis]
MVVCRQLPFEVFSRLMDDEARESRTCGNAGAALREQNLCADALMLASSQVAVAKTLEGDLSARYLHSYSGKLCPALRKTKALKC